MRCRPVTTRPTNISTAGQFNYLDSSVEHSLYRNGKVLTRRDKDGNDAGREGVDLVATEVSVSNARLADSTSCTLEQNGFELVEDRLNTRDFDFFSQENVIGNYYSECAQLVKDKCGATVTAAFDHNVRSAVGKESKRRIDGGQNVQGPAHIVHGDYTLTSAPQRLRDLSSPPTGNDTLSNTLEPGQSLLDRELVENCLEKGRFAIINVWRNIVEEPVVTHPLALCDGQSVEPEDLVVFEIHYQDRVGENYFAKHADGHQWFYYPELTGEEALLIKQWDSEGSLARSGGKLSDHNSPDKPCTFSFHSAFEDPKAPADAPDRWSIEVRCIALFE